MGRQVLRHQVFRHQVVGVVAFAAVWSLSPVQANTPTPLGATELRATFSGKRVFLATPLGGEFPLNYRADGRVDGSGEAIGLGRWVRPTDKGRWWISGNKLCQQWETWYDGKPFCFVVRTVSPGRVEWVRDDGMKGMARLAN